MLLAGLVLPDTGHAGAWTREKGEAYAELGGYYYWAEENFDSHGDIHYSSFPESYEDIPDGNLEAFDLYQFHGRFETFYSKAYFEYGLLNKLTLVVDVPFKYNHYLGNDQESVNSGVGDIEVAARYGLLVDPCILSLQVTGKLPYAYDADDYAALGNGQEDIEVRFLVGKSLYPIPAYLNAEAAYRLRLEAPSDELRFLAEFGMDVGKRVMLQTKVDAKISIQNGDTVPYDPTSAFVPNQYDLITFYLQFAYKLTERIWAKAYWAPDVWGRNILHGRTFSIGFFSTF